MCCALLFEQPNHIKMKLMVVGDLSLQDRTAKMAWDDNQLNNAFADIKSIVATCDHAIVNLESPVTSSNQPILKKGPSLKNNPEVFNIIGYCGFDTVTLANNHLKDYGEKGVVDTLDHCRQRGLTVVGGGGTLNEARQPLILKNDNITIGVINVCEHEFSVATKQSAGANPLDYPNLFEDMQALRREVDKIIVIIHGGREHYQLPTPRMKREYQMIADFGADVIVNHHQHCYSGYEVYKGKPIFYGLGNFFFDEPKKRDDQWNQGLLLQLDVETENVDFKLISYEQCNKEAVVRVSDDSSVAKQIKELNSIIADDERLEAEFNKLVEKDKRKLLFPFIPYRNHYVRALYNRGYLSDGLSKKDKVVIENAISCETHRELLLHFFYSHLHERE